MTCQQVNSPRRYIDVSISACGELWEGVATFESGPQLRTSPVGSQGAAWLELSRALYPPPPPAMDVQVNLKTMGWREVPAAPAPTAPWDVHLREAGALIRMLQGGRQGDDAWDDAVKTCDPLTSTVDRRRLVAKQLKSLGRALIVDRLVTSRARVLSINPDAVALRRTELWHMLLAHQFQFRRELFARAMMWETDLKLTAHVSPDWITEPTSKHIQGVYIEGGPQLFGDEGDWASGRVDPWMRGPSAIEHLRRVIALVDGVS